MQSTEHLPAVTPDAGSASLRWHPSRRRSGAGDCGRCAQRDEAMNKFAQGTCLSVVMGLLMIQSAWADAYRHRPTGIVFPDRIATLEKETRVTDYEAEHPGLGVSIGYNGPGITVTIYVYTTGMKTIPTDLQSSILKDHFKQAASDIVRAGEMGHYSNVKKISDGEAVWAPAGTGTTSFHASYSYTQRGRDRLSHLYLMGYQNHFLKVRFTYDKEAQEAAEKIQKDFLEEFSRILAGNGEKTHNQGVQATR